jgi:hypothetical protein
MGGGAEAPPEMMEEAATPLNGCLLGRKNSCSQFFVLAREKQAGTRAAARASGKNTKKRRGVAAFSSPTSITSLRDAIKLIASTFSVAFRKAESLSSVSNNRESYPESSAAAILPTEEETEVA